MTKRARGKTSDDAVSALSAAMQSVITELPDANKLLLMKQERERSLLSGLRGNEVTASA